VIELNKVKIEKKKTQRVVDWLERMYRSFWDWKTIINSLSKILQE